MTKRLAAGLLGDDYQHRAKDILSQRFLFPPFSVLNTREGAWQERKRQWLSLGIQSELGRGVGGEAPDASPGGSPKPSMSYSKDKARGDGRGRAMLNKETANLKDGLTWKTTFDPYDRKGGKNSKANAKIGGSSMPLDRAKAAAEGEPEGGGTSVFDPVLCELIYRWFCPPKGTVLDPFAGGSVRGIVAGEMGLQYYGIELSERQIYANEAQAAAIKTKPLPVWINGDSLDIRTLVHPDIKDGSADLLFSCPPYGDLERYSDDPCDLSTLDADAFREKYFKIIGRSCMLLKDGAFAVFVVGDYRDKKTGFYENLQGVTTDCFEAAGLHLYNTAILVNATGSLPLRINAQFTGSRKLGNTHQYVLVYCKGQPREFVPKWKVEL